MEGRKYNRIEADRKIEALQKHMMEKKPVSEICEELSVQPSVFYGWQRDLFARGASIFAQRYGRPAVDRSAERIAYLEAKLAKKDEVIAELLQEHVTLKKTLGMS